MNPQQEEGAGTKQDRSMERGKHMGDYGIVSSRADHIRLALAPRDTQNATYLPAAGWPPYRDLYGRDSPAPFSYEASQTAELGTVRHRTTYSRATGTDIV